MLEIYTINGWLPITNRTNYRTVYNYDGTQNLLFDIPSDCDISNAIANESQIRNENNLYLVKMIDKRPKTTTITCDLDMDDWKQEEPYLITNEIPKFKTKSLQSVLESIKPRGWNIQNAGIRSIQRTVELEDATDYDVLMKCQEIFNVVYEIHCLSKEIVVIDPELVVDKGVYITKQLNLKEVAMTGDSNQFATRLTAYGKQNEDGTYVDFSSINGGKRYIDDNAYADKENPIWITWKDERYTDPESLLEDAKKKLKELAYPATSFEVTINDLSETEGYEFLKLNLYDIAHVIIDKNTEIIEKVIGLHVYHDNLRKNKVILSSKPQTITSKVGSVISSIGENGEKIKGSILQQAQKHATELINSWAQKGNVYITENEIFILDKLPKESAKYCIRMNMGGIGFSQNGWKGPYNSAWTIDGKFNADFITGGTIQGIKLKGNEIEGAKITGGEIIGGSIKGDTTIHVGTDLHVGNDIYLGDQNSVGKAIHFKDSSWIDLNDIYLSIEHNNKTNIWLSDDYILLNMYHEGISYSMPKFIVYENEVRACVNFYALDGIKLNNVLKITYGGDYVGYIGAYRWDRMEMSSEGDVGLESVNSTVFLDGGFAVQSNKPITISSDVRKKHDIEDVDVSWISDLEIKTFIYNDDVRKNSEIGIIANDYEDKEYAKYFLDEDKEGFYSVRYQNITNALVKYAQQMNEKIESMEKDIEMLKNQLKKEVSE